MSGVGPEAPSARPDARTRILDAASEIVLREGFAGASVDAVAASVRMSKLSIYELFSTKVALFEAAVRNASEANFVTMPMAADDGDIDASLVDIGHRFFDGFIDPVNFGLFRANIVAANHFPELAADLHMHRLRSSHGVATYLQSWVERGILADLDTGTAAIRFGGLCVQGSRYFLGAPAPLENERSAIVSQAARLFLHGYEAANSGDVPQAIVATPPSLPGKVALRMSPDRLSKLIDAATDEFLTNGYRGASVDRVVAVIQAGRTTVYRQFGNKEGLFRYVVEQAIHVASQIEFRATGGSELEAEVADLARQMLDLHCEPANIRMHRLLIQEEALIPDLARRFHDMRVGRLGEALAAVLRKHGMPAPDEAMIGGFYVLATFSLRYLTVATLPDTVQREREARETARLFLHGAQQA